MVARTTCCPGAQRAQEAKVLPGNYDRYRKSPASCGLRPPGQQVVRATKPITFGEVGAAHGDSFPYGVYGVWKRGDQGRLVSALRVLEGDEQGKQDQITKFPKSPNYWRMAKGVFHLPPFGNLVCSLQYRALEGSRCAPSQRFGRRGLGDRRGGARRLPKTGDIHSHSYNPNSDSPAWSSGRRPKGQKNLRSEARIGRSLMLAWRRCIRPSGRNSQFSLP